MTEASTEPVYFWQETHSELGYLSQWYYCPFRDDKDPTIVYKTAEHYMMYHKAVVFKDTASAAEILKASAPKTVKALGRKVANFDSKTWDKVREEVVHKGNILKFTNAVTEEGFRKGSEASSAPIEGSLKDMLLATGDRELVEASPFDRIWGVGFAAKNAEGNRDSWGLNLLGKTLTKVRAEFREQDEAKAKDDEA